MQMAVLAAKQLDYGKADGIRPARRPSGEHAVRSIVKRRRSQQIEVTGSIELPEDEQMGETLDIGKPEFEFRQNVEHTFRLMFRVETLRNFGALRVRPAVKSNRPGKNLGARPLPRDHLTN